MTTKGYRIPEHHLAAAYNALAKFRAELLEGIASNVGNIDDPAVVFTVDEIVAGPRVTLAPYFKADPHTYMEIGPFDGLSYGDIYNIFFGDEYVDAMQNSMALTVVVLREVAQAEADGDHDAAVAAIKEIERKFVYPMLMKAIAYCLNR
ncbi:hypothetical protein [Neorhizobium tomejilense]|uniref:hypothetical protein n=1 Tax=Neorhizobium tomejilense TaxID=2093828 RepID=UPI003ECD89B2